MLGTTTSYLSAPIMNSSLFLGGRLQIKHSQSFSQIIIREATNQQELLGSSGDINVQFLANLTHYGYYIDIQNSIVVLRKIVGPDGTSFK